MRQSDLIESITAGLSSDTKICRWNNMSFEKYITKQIYQAYNVAYEQQ